MELLKSTYVSRLVLLLLLILGTASARRVLGDPPKRTTDLNQCKKACEKDPSGSPSWDYLQLVRQWPVSFCDATKCTKRPPNSATFTLHGLWPERNKQVDNKWWPECCDPRNDYNPAALKDILSKLQTQWPSWTQPDDCFWKHEWDKHGTCAASTLLGGSLGYFNTTLVLHRKFDIEKALAAANIEPSNTRTYTNKEVHDALRNAFGKRAFLSCSKNNKNNVSVLKEVTTCFSKKPQPEIIDCTRNSQCGPEIMISSGSYTFDDWGNHTY